MEPELLSSRAPFFGSQSLELFEYNTFREPEPKLEIFG
jgi:hypothetical protein